MKFGLSQTTIQKLQSVFKKYSQLEQVVLYGSRAKGNYKEASDIDLTIKGENCTAAILSSIKSEIDDLNTPYLFDISIYDTITSESLVEHIDRVGVVFFEK